MVSNNKGIGSGARSVVSRFRCSASFDQSLTMFFCFLSLIVSRFFSTSQGPIKELALLEPLVDCCDPDQVISNAASVINIGTHTRTRHWLFSSRRI